MVSAAARTNVPADTWRETGLACDVTSEARTAEARKEAENQNRKVGRRAVWSLRVSMGANPSGFGLRAADCRFRGGVEALCMAVGFNWFAWFRAFTTREALPMAKLEAPVSIVDSTHDLAIRQLPWSSACAILPTMMGSAMVRFLYRGQTAVCFR